MAVQLIALLLGTFVSEDLTCLTAGTLVSRGQLTLLAAVSACALGIFFGDMGLWLTGRFLGARVLSWPRVSSALPSTSVERFAIWFEGHTASAILGSRFVPGTRLPLYLAAGASRSSFSRFAAWTFVGGVLSTNALVLGAAFLESQIDTRLGGWFFWGRYAALPVVAGMLVIWRMCVRARWQRIQQRLAASFSRIWRWEFWPMWLFYAPVGLWVLWLAVRHGGFGTLTAANPGIPDGGVVGESKFDILRRLPREWTIPTALVEEGAFGHRMKRLSACMEQRCWSFPLVLKPDVGQRGTGVRLVHTMDDAAEYLLRMTGPVLAQPYHPGPFEAGVFYYRLPGWKTGRILAITDKHFPAVTGDGRSSIEDLVWSHERYRMQARTFLARLGARRREVPAPGARVSLGIAGNHAQGAMFTDGGWMSTPALESRIDAIALEYPGFYIGRFDVRYSSPERFMAGEDIAIVELNGATAECTNIYDPDHSLLSAYRTLFRQWRLVFAIGSANRLGGGSATSLDRLLTLLKSHFRSSSPFPIAD